MQLKNLFTEDRAVSPVIGVILMVAITVILAAVIGTFVLGLGDQVSETAPQASFSFDYSGADNLTITHESGEQIAANQVSIAGNISSPNQNWDTYYGGSDPVSAGSSIIVNASGTEFANGDTVRIIWTSESGSTSSTLQKWTYNG